MIINIDTKGAEWYAVVWFAQDAVGIKEILNEVDQHAENQRTFNLPERRIAKIFVFRLIYGGSAWSYALDPDFNQISKSPKFWQKVIDRFYEKYSGIKKQHDKWMSEAVNTGRLIMPTGRIYTFKPFLKNGGLEWPRTCIVNYPVQGFANDLVTIARVSLFKRVNLMKHKDILFVSTVHDSVAIDTPERYVGEIVSIIREVFSDVPRNFSRLFGVEFNLPVRCEISIGPNMKELDKIQ